MEQNGMNIALIAEQLAYIELTIQSEDEFDVYGGTTRAGFEFQQVAPAQWHITVRENEVAGAAIRPFDIYARQRSSGREWVVLSGRIFVKPRTADIEGDKLSPVEYHVTVPVVDSVLETQGMAIVTGIPGPQGPQGEKGDPGEGGMTAEERATLAGAAQRDADNTFTAANTFTGSVDMSTASVTPPEGWNVEGVTAEAIQAVAPIKWNSTLLTLGNGCSVVNAGVAVGVKNTGLYQDIIFGSDNATGDWYSVLLGHGVKTGTGKYQIAIGYKVNTEESTTSSLAITLGSAFEDTSGKYECTTQGTGSITIGAGANTKNNGTTESINSVTIGCKALNQGADSVVIGAQASNTGNSAVVIGAGSTGKLGAVMIGTGSAETSSVSIGKGVSSASHGIAIGYSTNSIKWAAAAIGYASSANGENALALGQLTKAQANNAIAIGKSAQVADLGAVAFRSTAEDGTYTQLYFSGANTPLANTYHSGAPMLGYVTKDSAGNIVAAGTRSLIDLLTDNSTFAPASLDENGEWVMPKVFHPSDLDLPTEEPSEVEEYEPLPVYPIVEPSEDDLRTPTQEI